MYNPIKALCDLIADRDNFVENLAVDNSEQEICRLFTEAIFNLIVENGVNESIAEDIATKLTAAYLLNN